MSVLQKYEDSVLFGILRQERDNIKMDIGKTLTGFKLTTYGSTKCDILSHSSDKFSRIQILWKNFHSWSWLVNSEFSNVCQ